MGRVRVYMATSLDGFIAADDHGLDWLDQPVPAETDALTFDGFLTQVGAMMMGRTTFDVVSKMGPWPYGDVPVHVPTHRALNDAPPTVQAVAGPIDALLDDALEAANGRDLYLDGGALVRQALDAGRVDELTLTIIPLILGSGVRLFDTSPARQAFVFQPPRAYGTMVQITAVRA